MPLPILPMLAASVAGAFLGCLTGLVPGLHSNNVASLIGANPGFIVGIATLGLVVSGGERWTLLASCAVVACAVAHTVANIVPSIYLAVPEGETALSVLPGHRMVLAGRGEEALRVSVLSSLLSLTVALALVVPLHYLMGPPLYLYDALEGWVGALLVAVAAFMIVQETTKANDGKGLGGWRAGVAATGVFVTAGALGHLAIFRLELVGPTFIGLFGVPMVMFALIDRRSEREDDEVAPRTGRERMPWLPALRGTFAGALVGWLPGISSAQATILAMPKEEGAENDMDGARRFIASVSAVNTANAVFTVVALVTLLRVRSGAVAAVDGLMAYDSPPWAYGVVPGLDVTALLMAAAVGGLVGVPVTWYIGKRFHAILENLSSRRMLVAILMMLVVMVAWGGNPLAVAVVVIAAGLGMVPPLLGLMRVHLMGVVTLPLALGLLIV